MYLSHETVNWVWTAGFTVFAFIGFYFGFLILWLLYYSCLHPALPLVFYSISLQLLSYYIMHVLCLLSFTISLPAPGCSCLQHGFQCMLFWFGFIDTRVFIPTRHLAFATPLVGEFWLPWILMSRSWSLELVDSSCWSEWRSGSIVDQRKISPRPYPSRPLLVSRVFLL